MNLDRLISIEAPAKVNLFLHLLAKREDGFHDLESLVAFAEFGDSISIHLSDEINLSVKGVMSSLVPEDNRNIVLRVANLLREKFKISLGASIILKKNLPVSAGLGGGSSDAAATFWGLVVLWKINLNLQELIDLSCEFCLGADIPVCLTKKPALIKGIGEKIQTLDCFSSLPILLVNPGVPISTKEIFSQVTIPEKCPIWEPSKSIIESLNYCRNDLQSEAIIKAPVIKDILLKLEEMEGCFLSRVSGSGSTCYGLFDSDKNLKIATENFIKYDDWWVMPTKLKGTKSFK